ncbi:MAG: GNAT family N-acetyltransferase [Solibacillus sp.]
MHIKGGLSLNISLLADEHGFELLDGDQQFGNIVWQLDGDVMVMNGTVVDPSLRGQDYGTKPLDEAAEYARRHHYKMEAICPFIVKKFEKTTAYDDLKV